MLSILHLSPLKRSTQVDCSMEGMRRSGTGGSGGVGAAGSCFIALSERSQAASLCLFLVFIRCLLHHLPTPLLASHPLTSQSSFFTGCGCQAPGRVSPVGTRMAPRPPTDTRSHGCWVAVPAKPRFPSARALSCVGDLRSGKQKLHVSTGWGGESPSLRASVAGPAGTEEGTIGSKDHDTLPGPEVRCFNLCAPEETFKTGLASL